MNILLVDDERLAVEVMNRMIDKEKYGFSTIYKALSMKQAQQICEETDIDIIICDIEMPRGSGLDFVQWLLDTGRNPIVIFLTSHAVFSYAQQAVSLGVQDYLLKPVEPEDMNQALEKAIRNAKSRKKSILKEEKIRKLNEGVQSAEKNIAEPVPVADVIVNGGKTGGISVFGGFNNIFFRVEITGFGRF